MNWFADVSGAYREAPNRGKKVWARPRRLGTGGIGAALFQTPESGPDFISVPSPEAMCLVATIENEFDSSDRFMLIERPQSVVEIVAPTSGALGTSGGEIGAVLSWGSRAAPILSLLPDLQICKFVKAYAHRRVNLEAVAASSSASSEATDGPTGV